MFNLCAGIYLLNSSKFYKGLEWKRSEYKSSKYLNVTWQEEFVGFSHDKKQRIWRITEELS